jgi:hypothetical protein
MTCEAAPVEKDGSQLVALVLSPSRNDSGLFIREGGRWYHLGGPMFGANYESGDR